MDSTSRPRTYAVAFLAAACAGIGLLAWRILTPFLPAMAWSAILATVLHGPWIFLEKRMRARRNLAAILMTLATALLVILPAGLFAGLLASQAMEVAGAVHESLENENVTSFADVVALPNVAGFIENVERRFGLSRDEFAKLAAGFAARTSSILGEFSQRLILSAFDQVLTFCTTIFLLFFLLRDGEAMAKVASELIPIEPDERASLIRSIRLMIVAIFRGSFLCALAQGVSGGIGWWIAGLGSSALAGAAMCVMSLLPLGGTALVWIPGCAWAWYSGHPGSALFLFIWGLVVTSFLADNVLRPMLIGRSQDLNTLVVLLGVFGGIAAFGLLGIFLGPIVLVLATLLVDVLRAQAAKHARTAA